MKKRSKKLLALLLCGVLLTAALPAASAAADGERLYSWTASTLAEDQKNLSSNLISNAGAAVCWNDTATMYTDSGKSTVSVHTFLNEAVGRGSKAYGLPQSSDGSETENLMVDLYPDIQTRGYKAVGVSMIYAYAPTSGAQNAAQSGYLRVFVSEDGMSWSEDSAAVRSARIVGSGRAGKGTDLIFYEIRTENLMDIDSVASGDPVYGVRIMPDGENGTAKGQFGLCGVTVTGYDSVADFNAGVPAQAEEETGSKADMTEFRNYMVEAARACKSAVEMDVLQDAVSAVSSLKLPDSVASLLAAPGVQMLDGVATRATDRVKLVLERMYGSVQAVGTGREHTFGPTELTQEEAAAILAEYEKYTTTRDVVLDLNTPQQIMRSYGKAQAGDMIVQVTEKEAHAYLVLGSDPVYLADEINVDPDKSTLTYLTQKGEKTATYFELFAKENFVPMTLTDLAEGTLSQARVEVYATVTDGVSVAAVSGMNISEATVEVGGACVTLKPEAPGFVCSDEKLTQAVAALTDGTHTLTVTARAGAGDPVVNKVELTVKDGKATVVRADEPTHADTCPSGAMTDVDKNAWYHEAVDYVLTNGIMGGYNATTFGPNDTLSRAMVVQVLYNKEGQPAVSGKHDFTDVPADQWFNNAVTWGTRKGVMGGYGDGKFGPNDSVTIEQIAVILWNYAGNPAFQGSADSVGAHSGWAANGLAWAVENGILSNVPYEDVTAGATRAQTAQMLMNYLKAN